MIIDGPFTMCALFYQIVLLWSFVTSVMAYNNSDTYVLKNRNRSLISSETICPDGWTCTLVDECHGLLKPWLFVIKWCDEGSIRERLCCLEGFSSSASTTPRKSIPGPEIPSENIKSLTTNGTHWVQYDYNKIPVTNGRIHDVAPKYMRNTRQSQNITNRSPSKKACEEYSLLNKERIRVSRSNRIGGNLPNFTNLIHYVVRGEYAREKEFPFIVAIGYESKSNSSNSSLLTWGCGGSILSERFVLTAAHCITEADEIGLRPSVVRAGVSRLASDALRQDTDCRVATALRHPLHRPDQRHHDLALLRTDRPLLFSASVRPVCLPSADPAASALEAPGARLTAMGWGATNREGTDRSKDLKKVVLTVVSLEDCRKLSTGNQISGENFEGKILCAADPERKSDTCLGDSGGPLVGKLNGTTDILVAVTSFGSYPCAGQVPGVYARTLAELPWIESVVWP